MLQPLLLKLRGSVPAKRQAQNSAPPWPAPDFHPAQPARAQNSHPGSKCTSREFPSGMFSPARAASAFLPGRLTCLNQRPANPSRAKSHRRLDTEPRPGVRAVRDSDTLTTVCAVPHFGAMVHKYNSRIVRKSLTQTSAQISRKCLVFNN
jgi:hypothetical protein